MIEISEKYRERFWSKILIDKDNHWFFQGKKTPSRPRGAFTIGGNKSYPANIIAWILTKNEKLIGNFLIPQCGQKSCCNPDHMSEVADRSALMANSIGRGENTKQAKLKNKDIQVIRNSKESNKILAEKFGISATQISRIKHKVDWRSI